MFVDVLKEPNLFEESELVKCEVSEQLVNIRMRLQTRSHNNVAEIY